MGTVDLHVHSNASDGEYPPAEVVRRAGQAGLAAIALTDHDTIDGVPEAQRASAAAGVRVIAGCEFSVRVRWGEMHLLAYFLPTDDAELGQFLEGQRAERRARMHEIVRRLNHAGVAMRSDDIAEIAGGGAVGRPHAARALVARGVVRDIDEAFERYLRHGRPAFVAKALPAAREVIALVRRLGGVSSAAHLKRRATRATLEELRGMGVDGIEARHPSHDAEASARIERLAEELALLPTGGSDWHGDGGSDTAGRAPLGAAGVPGVWLDRVERVHHERRASPVSS